MKALFAALAMTLAATVAPAAQLTLERLFASPALSGPSPRSPKLSPDGRYATLLRSRPDDLARYDLWAIDTATGQQRMLVDSLKLGSGAALSEDEKMRRERARLGGTRGIVAYDWAPDGKSLLVPLDGDLWLAPLDGEPTKLPAPNGALDAQVSAGGGYVSFVRDSNLYAVDLGHGRAIHRLTQDGGGTVHWGSAEFVAQEEMDRFAGHWWAPRDAHVAVERYDEAKVPLVARAAIGSSGTKIYEQRYPAAGTPNVAVQLWIMAPDGSGKVQVDLGADPDIYLARVNWAPDGKTLYVQRESRDQKRLDLLAIDPATGAAKVVLSETSRTWINLNDGFHALRDGDFLWVSERSGFAHLYRGHEGALTPVTHGDWAIASVVGVDEARGRAFFLANKDDPVAQSLYAVDYRQPAAPAALTEPGWWNAAAMDRAATHALVARSSPTQPPQAYLADATGKRIAWIEENRLDAHHPYAPYLAAHVAPVFGTIKAADGTLLHTKLLLPKVAPGTRVPVLVQVYNGPGAGRQVLRQWGGDLPLHEYLVSKGWAVFSVDGRGSPDRGKAFEDPIYHALGTVEVADQLAGLAWLKAQPWADARRIAVYGWSYGGYMTLKLLEAAPGAYAAGVSGAPVVRWALYDTHYTERYLGDPYAAPPVYEQADALSGAAKIADPLLMLHGMADDNVFFDNSVAMYAALQQAGRPFEMMAYPGQGHAFAPDVRLQLWRVIERFLDRVVQFRR